MWYHMIACYFLSLLTFISVVTAFFQSFLRFPVFEAGRVTFMILTSIVYLLTETLVIFFFVEIGVQVKESTSGKKLDPQFHHRSIAIKRKVLPPLMSNMLLMMILFVLVGAVDTHRFPSWAYSLLFLGGIFHFVKTKAIQNQGFKESMELILEMSEIKQE